MPLSRRSRGARPDIITADGRTYRPRARVAADAGINDKTLRRKTTSVYVGGVAYVEVATAITDLVGKPKRRNEPVKPRRRTVANKQLEA
jgi:hypothetical protein